MDSPLTGPALPGATASETLPPSSAPAPAPATCTPADSDSYMSTSHPHFTRLLTLCLGLILFGGVMSGLQQAVMQVSPAQLTAMRRDGTESERKMAALLEPLLRRRHLTLVCLLIGNALAMEALPVFMDDLVPKAVAIVLSVTAVVLFSEIIPQALCLRWPMELAGLFSWLMYVLIAVLYPVAAPIAWVLDLLFGREHETLLTKGGLKELVLAHARAHGSEKAVLSPEELSVITGALDLHKLTCGQTMTPLARLAMVPEDARLTESLLGSIFQGGHSRLPVLASASSDVVVGLLLVKQLVRLEREFLVRDLDTILPILVVEESVSLFDVLRRFCRGESHMAIVVRNGSSADSVDGTPRLAASVGVLGAPARGIRLCDPGRPATFARGALGALTLEDVLEALLRVQIEDEKDAWRPAVDDIESRLSRVDALIRSFAGGAAGVSPSTAKRRDSQSPPLLLGRSGKPPSTTYGALQRGSGPS